MRIRNNARKKIYAFSYLCKLNKTMSRLYIQVLSTYYSLNRYSSAIFTIGNTDYITNITTGRKRYILWLSHWCQSSSKCSHFVAIQWQRFASTTRYKFQDKLLKNRLVGRRDWVDRCYVTLKSATTHSHILLADLIYSV